MLVWKLVLWFVGYEVLILLLLLRVRFLAEARTFVWVRPSLVLATTLRTRSKPVEKEVDNVV